MRVLIIITVWQGATRFAGDDTRASARTKRRNDLGSRNVLLSSVVYNIIAVQAASQPQRLILTGTH